MGLRFDLTARFVFPAHDPAEQEIQNMFSLSFSPPSLSLQRSASDYPLSLTMSNIHTQQHFK